MEFGISKTAECEFKYRVREVKIMSVIEWLAWKVSRIASNSLKSKMGRVCLRG